MFISEMFHFLIQLTFVDQVNKANGDTLMKNVPGILYLDPNAKNENNLVRISSNIQ